jgi:hypothetical protein
MKSKLILSLLAVSGLAFVPAMTSARVPQSDSPDKSASVRTLTGCLSAGEKTGEYNLLAEDGSTWEIRSKSVKLHPHVGHTVTVTGKVWHADLHGAKEKTKEAVDPGASEHGHLNVSEVSMVSDSCKK